MHADVTPHAAVQGAEIGANAFIDALDVSDWDLLEVGDDVAIGEGATVLAHSFKDGHLHFGQARDFGKILGAVNVVHVPKTERDTEGKWKRCPSFFLCNTVAHGIRVIPQLLCCQAS